MPEPLEDAYLKEIQDRVTAVPKGPWGVESNDYGLPDAVGPVAFIQTWVDAHQVPIIQFIGHSRTDVPALLGEVARLRALTAGQESGAAFGWAARLDADDLEGFLLELSETAAGDDDLSTLQRVEKVVRTWRLIAVAQHAHNTAPGPDGGAS